MTYWGQKKESGCQKSISERMINLSEFDNQNILTLTGSFNDYCNLADGYINKTPGLLHNI